MRPPRPPQPTPPPSSRPLHLLVVVPVLCFAAILTPAAAAAAAVAAAATGDTGGAGGEGGVIRTRTAAVARSAMVYDPFSLSLSPEPVHLCFLANLFFFPFFFASPILVLEKGVSCLSVATAAQYQ